jgi:sec-independent protein translocase protein TatA
MFGRLGPMELVLILVIALVVFGPAKLPEIGKAMGKAIREFKSSANGEDEDIEQAKDVIEDEKND